MTLTTLIGCSADIGNIRDAFTDIFADSSECSSISPHTLDNAPMDADFSVTFLDVGQADAAVIQSNGHYMLIDGGNKDDSSLIYQYLLLHDITHLDLVIGTHADEDHIGGLAGAFHFADADLTLCSTDTYDSDAFRDFKKYAFLRGGGISIPSVGDTHSLGDAVVEILAINSGDESNDSSIVTKITYGETSFLFTGDAEAATEQFLLDSGTDLHADVLKVGHHGSANSSSGPFLSAVQPSYSVVSVGENIYGHPNNDVLNRLSMADSTVLRTDVYGDIFFTSDGTSVSCYTEFSPNSEVRESISATLESNVESSHYETTYILNTRSKKFHIPTCESVEKMSENNKLEFQGSREEVLELKYEPCGGCRP